MYYSLTILRSVLYSGGSQPIDNTPSTPPTSPPTPKSATNVTKKPTSKIWKSTLKEHYDKTRKGEKVEIKYVSKENPKGGWMSNVYCPDIGYAEGEGTSKAAAEHNAAYNALLKLGVVDSKT